MAMYSMIANDCGTGLLKDHICPSLNRMQAVFIRCELGKHSHTALGEKRPLGKKDMMLPQIVMESQELHPALPTNKPRIRLQLLWQADGWNP